MAKFNLLLKLLDAVGVTVNPATLEKQQEILAAGQDVVSTLNSTTTALGANQNKTGTFEDLLGFAGVSVLLRTDQNSAVNGAMIEWSDDGVTTRRISSSTVAGSASQGYFFFLPKQGRYGKINYTNGGVAQTTFFVQTIKVKNAPTGSVVPLFGPIDLTSSGLLTRSVIAGQSTAGGTTLVNVKVNPSGTLATGNTSVGVLNAAIPVEATLLGASDGANLQALRVGGGTEALAVRVTVANDSTGVLPVTGPLTDAQLRAAPLPLPAGASTESTLSPIRNRFSPSTGDAVEVTDAGDTAIYAPAPGKRIRLKWLGFSSHPSMPSPTKVTARFGANSPFYRWWMGAPGAFAHGVVREGAVDEALTVNCSAAPGVATPLLVNLDIEEF